MLKKIGFTVTLMKNAKLQEMDEAIREFGRQIKRSRGVGLFFYAGHGLQINGVNYLVPVNARIEKESDVRFQSINADLVLAEMEHAENRLNIVILDACRDNPFARSFRNASRGLAIISNAPVGTVISYSTGANQVARDGDGRNSPYTRALLAYMDKPGMTINSVFMNVRSKVRQETGQVPWELSSLMGDFYFVPRASKKETVRMDALDEESQKLEAERQRLDQEKAALARQRELAEQRRAIEAERERLAAEQERLRKAEAERDAASRQKKLAMAGLVPASRGNEIKREGRFIAYDNGTVLDTKTNLMWAAKDSGEAMKWANAKSYCENYRGGGYTDWRMPTQDELAGLYDSSLRGYAQDCGSRYLWVKLTNLIHISCCCPWASETRGSEAASFGFASSDRLWYHQSRFFQLALPVRSGK